LPFVSVSESLFVLDTEANGTKSAWVVQTIQVASGRSAAVESSTSESRVEAVCVGSSSQLCQCPLSTAK
jgi:hypothetical protein